MAANDSSSTLYGASQLWPAVDLAIGDCFDIAGSTSMPIGHNPDTFSRGLAYEVGQNGRHKGHALTIGRTRGGKGVSTIIPALLTYKGSMVVIDPKGENAWITAERRRQLGQRVVILDPWNEVNKRYGAKVGVTETITNFNPLSALDPSDPDFADDITAIAEAFILQTGNDPHWPDSARELVGGITAAEIQRNPGTASMRDVRKLLRAPIVDLQSAVASVLKEFPDSVAAGKLAAILETDENGKPIGSKEISSIRSTARTQTGFLDSARLLDSMETADNPFNLTELATGNVTLYLVLPVDRLKSHGRWLRMILTLAIRAISKQPTPPENPVVMILDELGTISPGSGLSMIEQSYGLMAGLGIRIWAFLQDLPQLKRDYPESWETFISNSSVIQLLNVGDETTATYFSQYLGNMTIYAKTGGWTLKQKRYGNGQWSYSENLNQQTKQLFLKHLHTHLNKVVDDAKADYFLALDLHSKEALSVSNDVKTSLHWARENAARILSEQGFSQQGHTDWSEDEQLSSRPVKFPWEVREADATKSLIIVPGSFNTQLKRFVYYSSPLLSKWARHDPNKPPPVVITPTASPAPLASPAPPPARFDERTGRPLQPAANTNQQPPANSNQLIAEKAGKLVGGFLDKLNKL